MTYRLVGSPIADRTAALICTAAFALAGCGGKDEGNAGAAYTATFAPPALSGSITVAGNPQPWNTTVTFDRAPDAAVNLGIVDVNGVASPGSVTVTPQGGGSYRIALSTSGSLAAGNYRGNLQLRACRDSVTTCAQPLPGSPWQLPYSLSALPSLASVENQCSSLDAQRTWVRSYVNEAYLWYREVPAADPTAFSTPQAYFEALRVRTPTASGKPRDQFSFATDTAAFNAVNAGLLIGYGIQPMLDADGRVRVAYVEPGSPAAVAGVARGDTIVSIDGQLSSDGAGPEIQAALFPPAAGQTRAFTVRSVSGAQRTVDLTSAVIAVSPVLTSQVLNMGGARIGYVVFNGFVLSAQDQLIAAIGSLRSAGIDDLVLDLRYNGGGLVAIAAQIGYMIGGQATEGKVFERSRANEKRVVDNSDENAVLPFVRFRYDLAADAETSVALPTLNLRRVFMLTTEGTCSASESLINGLRGVDIEVITVGSTTCGKPYGFTPRDNCGISYLPVEFEGVNAKGFGDYADGFTPTCSVSDDLSRQLGDPAEGMLAAALARRATGQCPATAQARSVKAGGQPAAPGARLLRSPVQENKYRLR
jgi:carboxyl-terminal processing protease